MDKAKCVLIISIALALFVFVGCDKNVQTQQTSGLQIYTLSTALGGDNQNSLDKTILTYSFSLTNGNKTDIYIKSVEPIFSGPVSGKVMSKNISLVVSKMIKPAMSIQVTGKILINTTGLSKSDIVKLEPMIKSIHITSEQNIPVQS